jgi:elongation factor 1-alpha
MITGTSQADVALLILPASDFASAFSDEGQAREHTLLAYTLGIRQLIVAVNKMDAVNWDEKKFNEIKSEFEKFVATVGFKKELVK